MMYCNWKLPNSLWQHSVDAYLDSPTSQDFSEQDRRIADICYEIHVLDVLYQAAGRSAAEADYRGKEDVLDHIQDDCTSILHRAQTMLNELKTTTAASMTGLLFKAEILIYLLPRFQTEGSEEHWNLLNAFADEVAVHHSSIAISSPGALRRPPRERVSFHLIAESVSCFLSKPEDQAPISPSNSPSAECETSSQRELEAAYLAQQNWLEAQLLALTEYDLRSAVEVVALADVVIHLTRQELSASTSGHTIALALKICDKVLYPIPLS